jgi:hypothetical protein
MKKSIKPNFKRVLLFLISALIMGQSAPAAETGKTGWGVFRIAQSFRAKALASTFTGSSDLSGILYNPAITANKTAREFLLISEIGFSEDKLGGFIYGQPLNNGTLSGGAVYYNAGQIELNWLESGTLKTEEVSAQQDILGFLSYSRVLNEQCSMGLTLKGASSKLVARELARAYATDIGLSYKPWPDLYIAAAVQNLGDATKFIEEKNLLPLSGYLGLGYAYQVNKFQLKPVLGFTYNLNEQHLVSETGIEFGYESLSLNISYLSKKEANLQFGIGLNLNNIVFGYAYIAGVYLDPSHRISLGYKFGSIASAGQEATDEQEEEQEPEETVQEQDEPDQNEDEEESGFDFGQ